MRRNIIITLGWGFAICAYAMGQTSNGTIQGFVSDSSGAVIPRVTVVVSNELTGAVQRAITASDGSYIMPGLLPGQYSITVTLKGFSRFLQSGVNLEINQQLRVDIVLNPGSQTQVVRVTGATTQVETRTAALSQVVGNTEMIELPLNGRFTVDLVGLSAGVAPMGNPYMGTGNSDTPNVFAQSNSQVPFSYNISGGRGNGVNYMLNGGSNMDPNVNTSAAMPSPDAVQEFSLQNSGYEAEFGGSGGTVNLVTKSGTNLLHGSAYDYLRNGDLNARNFFSTTQDTLIRNQFGFAVGGPVYLPKVFDGRNRSFFFANYEGTRINSTSSAGSAATPTAAMRGGNLSAISTPIIDPTTGQQFDYQGIPNNINPNRLDQGMLKMLSAFVGLPGSDGLLHYTTSPVKQPANQYTLRGDENIREHDRMFVNYFFTRSSDGSTGTAGNGFDAPLDNQWQTGNFSVSETHLFGPALVNTAQFTRVHVYWAEYQSPANQNFLFKNLGINVVPTPVPGTTIQPESVIQTANFTVRIPNGAPASNFSSIYDWSDVIGWVHGRHEFKFGADVQYQLSSFTSFWLSDGRFHFGSSFTGNGFGDMLLGLPTQFYQLNPEYSDNTRPMYGFYAQDKLQVSRRLSLTYGLRWQPFVNWKESKGQVSYWEPGQQSKVYPNLPPDLLVAGDNGLSSRGLKTSVARVAPRLGFAYDPLGNGKWSIRGGYGMFLEDTSWVIGDNSAGTTPFVYSSTLVNPPSFSNPWGASTNLFPAALPTPHNAPFPLPMGEEDVYDPRLKNPYMQDWNLTIEHQLPSNILVRASYVGSKGTRLLRTKPLNWAVYIPGNNSQGQPLSTVANESSRMLLPNYTVVNMGTGDGDSIYNGLQFSVERPFYHNIQLKANYTYSKTIDNGFQTFGPVDGLNVRDPLDPGLDRGRADFDITNRLLTSFVAHPWDPKGGNFLLDHVFGNWVTTGIVTAQQGFPITIWSGYDNSLTGLGEDTANQVGNPRAIAGIQNRQMEWFNTGAFAPNTIGTYGTSGRNIVASPGLVNVDFGLYKDFKISRREGTYVEFRSEYFNILNHTNFGQPVNTLTSSTFGQILSANPPRILQFALRLNF